jgi:hypothetical protein
MSNAFAVGYFSLFPEMPMVRFSDETGRRHDAKGSIVEVASTICATQTQPSDCFWIVPGTAEESA